MHERQVISPGGPTHLNRGKAVILAHDTGMARHDLTTRAQALTLRVLGTSNDEILRQTGISTEIVDILLQQAIMRGFQPQSQHPIIRDRFIQATNVRRTRKEVWRRTLTQRGFSFLCRAA